MLFFCAYTGTPLVLALFLQDGLGFSPLHSGLTASAYAVGAAMLGARSPAGCCPGCGRGCWSARLVLFGVGVAAGGALVGSAAGRASRRRTSRC